MSVLHETRIEHARDELFELDHGVLLESTHATLDRTLSYAAQVAEGLPEDVTGVAKAREASETLAAARGVLKAHFNEADAPKEIRQLVAKITAAEDATNQFALEIAKIPAVRKGRRG